MDLLRRLANRVSRQFSLLRDRLGVFRELTRRIRRCPGTAVVLTPERPSWRARRWLARTVRTTLPGRLQVVVAGPGAEERLAHLGDVDLVVDLTTVSRARPPRAPAEDGAAEAAQGAEGASAWPHLRQGGAYVEVLSLVPSRRRRQRRRWLQPSGGRRVVDAIAAEHARSIGPVREHAGVLVVRKVAAHLLLLTEEDVQVLLPARSGVRVTPLAVRAGGTFDPGRRVTGAVDDPEGHGDPPATSTDGLLRAPVVQLRHYAGPVELWDGMVVTAGSTVLPESFKWFDHRPLENRKLSPVGPRHARRRLEERPPESLAGDYYYFEYKNAGHYGHLLTEALAKLWAWPEVVAREPGVRLLMREHPRDARRKRPRADLRLLEAFGIGASDVTWIRDPVRVQSLYAATPMLHNKPPYEIHPDLLGVWQRVRDGLLATEFEPPPRSERIFVTRHGGNRACRNHARVEALFASYGFTVLRPEQLDVAQQAAVFDAATVVAGFGGTGMFNLIFATSRPTVIVLNQESYDARNEDLISGVLGCDLHYFWSAADQSHPPGEFSYSAFQSGWEFDFDRNEAALRGLLAGL
ncbi:glycosyltransferase family 61 protein [Nocardioides campestrisoli]|uniref:glycosyltransferase family 61 protein n=1 Tax=Nocardioides campestrisoli TaxID=2736757 RepID=UPI0015E72919|nr:glycosyltransferase 61 family protein [Nocardioides campestrisoli]